MERNAGVLFAGCAGAAIWRLLSRHSLHIHAMRMISPVSVTWLALERPAEPNSSWEDVMEAAVAAVATLCGSPSAVRTLDQVPYFVVESAEALLAVSRRLRGVSAIAVDVEHSPASFHGHVCTLQLSTADEDVVIDCLVPEVRAALPHALRDIFWSPTVVKVLHSASNDARWLSSNFGLQLRCMVDTGIVAKLVNQALGATSSSTDASGAHACVADSSSASGRADAFPRDSSLAALLMHYFGFRSDKRFQRSDWRMRPLPSEMLRYARSDTRYLLPLAQRLLRDLVAATAAQRAASATADRAAESTGKATVSPRSDEPTSSAIGIITDVLRRSNIVAQSRYARAERERFVPASALDCARGRVAPALHAALQSLAGHAVSTPVPHSSSAGDSGGDAPAAGSGDSTTSAPVLAAAALAEQRCALLFCCLMATRHAIGLAEDVSPEMLAERDSLLATAAVVTLLMVLPQQPQQPSTGRTSTVAAAPAMTADQALSHPLAEHALAGWAASLRASAVALIRWCSPTALDVANMLRLLQLFGVGRVSVDAAGRVSVSESGNSAGSDAAAAAAASAGDFSLASESCGAAGARPSREARKAARADNIFVPRAAPLYNNIALLAPDGTLIAKIDRRRAQWYVDVGLVEVLRPDEPSAAPQHRGIGAGDEAGDADADADADADTDADAGAGAGPGDVDALVDERQRARKERAAGALAAAGGPGHHDAPAHVVDLNELIATSGDPSEPLRLRMKRAPRGPGHAGDAFHLSEKRNECVVCGVTWEEAAAAFGGLNRSFIGELGLRVVSCSAHRSVYCLSPA